MGPRGKQEPALAEDRAIPGTKLARWEAKDTLHKTVQLSLLNIIRICATIALGDLNCDPDTWAF